MKAYQLKEISPKWAAYFSKRLDENVSFCLLVNQGYYVHWVEEILSLRNREYVKEVFGLYLNLYRIDAEDNLHETTDSGDSCSSEGKEALAILEAEIREDADDEAKKPIVDPYGATSSEGENPI